MQMHFYSTKQWKLHKTNSTIFYFTSHSIHSLPLLLALDFTKEGLKKRTLGFLYLLSLSFSVIIFKVMRYSNETKSYFLRIHATSPAFDENYDSNESITLSRLSSPTYSLQSVDA